MGKPVARIGDMHKCPQGVGPTAHEGGPLAGPGVPSVMVGGQPVAVVTDQATCSGATDTVVKGADAVLIGGRPVARMGDPTSHGGVIVMGLPTVIVGAGNRSAQIQALRAAAQVGRPLCEK